MVAGLAVSFADPGGPIELTKESMAAQRAIAEPPGDHELLIALSQDAMAHRRESADLKNALDLKARTAPEQIAEELRRVAGIVSESGSVLSHLAILAREQRVPVVVGVEDAWRRYPSGTPLTIDGATGEIRRTA